MKLRDVDSLLTDDRRVSAERVDPVAERRLQRDDDANGGEEHCDVDDAWNSQKCRGGNAQKRGVVDPHGAAAAGEQGEPRHDFSKGIATNEGRKSDLGDEVSAGGAENTANQHHKRKSQKYRRAGIDKNGGQYAAERHHAAEGEVDSAGYHHKGERNRRNDDIAALDQNVLIV